MFYAESFAEGGHLCVLLNFGPLSETVGTPNLAKMLRMMKRMRWAASILVKDSASAHLVKDFSKKTL